MATDNTQDNEHRSHEETQRLLAEIEQQLIETVQSHDMFSGMTLAIQSDQAGAIEGYGATQDRLANLTLAVFYLMIRVIELRRDSYTRRRPQENQEDDAP